MAWTEQDYQEIVARLMVNSIGVNEVPNADKADDVTSLPAFKPSGSNSKSSVVNYPLEFLKGEQGEPGIQGEPGKSFKVAGEYATLEALKSAVPDGSAVDGFMAVGTEAPYDYYAWVNGGWVSQGKIGGIDEAPSDGNAYGRKNKGWVKVPEKSDVISLPSALLKLTGQSNSSEILSVFGGLDALRTTIAKLRSDNYIIMCGDKNGNYSYVFDDYHVNYTDENNFKLSLFDISGSASVNANFLYMIVSLVDGVAEISSKREYSLVKDTDVLTKTNTSPFTPTQPYHPATKKYVDNTAYGKFIDVADGSLLTINKNIWGTEAYDHVVKIFGSTDVIKNVIIDICNNHTKYYIHSYSSYRNCIELSSVYAYYTDEERYEIEFNISYYTSQGPVSKRIAIALNLFDDDKSDDRLFIEDILVSDNLQRVVKRTKSEYDNIGTKNEYTMYAITDA